MCADAAMALVVSEIFPPAIGGSGELLSNVYKRLGEVKVTVLTDALGAASSARATLDDGPLTVIREPMCAPYWGVSRPAGLRHHLGQASRMRRLSRQRRTVIHCCRALPEGVGAWLATRMTGRRYVCWAHGEDISAAATSREFSILMRQVYRGAAALIANSRNTSQMLQSAGAQPDRIEVVYPGVDAVRFRPDVPEAAALRRDLLGDAQLLILTVGRLQRRKGHDMMLRAIASLPPDAPAVRYVIVGNGEERTHLETMVRELRLAERVRFVGAAPAEQLPAYYAAADMFVHPNRVDGADVEGFGIVFLEAAAAGLPVIAGASGGVPEAVARDETGLLVSGTDVQELQQAILQFARSAPLRRAMGAAGRSRVVRDFSWERAGSCVGAIHDRVSRGNRAAQP